MKSDLHFQTENAAQSPALQWSCRGSQRFPLPKVGILNVFIKCHFQRGGKLYERCNSSERLLFDFTSNLLNVFQNLNRNRSTAFKLHFCAKAASCFLASYGSGRKSRNVDKKHSVNKLLSTAYGNC